MRSVLQPGLLMTGVERAAPLCLCCDNSAYLPIEHRIAEDTWGNANPFQVHSLHLRSVDSLPILQPPSQISVLQKKKQSPCV